MNAVSLHSQLNSNQKRWNLNMIQANFVDHIVLHIELSHDWAYWCNLTLQKLFYAYRATFDEATGYSHDLIALYFHYNWILEWWLKLYTKGSFISLIFGLSAMFDFSFTNSFNCYKVILFDFAPNKNENVNFNWFATDMLNSIFWNKYTKCSVHTDHIKCIVRLWIESHLALWM